MQTLQQTKIGNLILQKKIFENWNKPQRENLKPKAEELLFLSPVLKVFLMLSSKKS